MSHIDYVLFTSTGVLDGVDVAVKVVIFEVKDATNAHRYKSAVLEAAINTSLLHTNVVKCLAYSIDQVSGDSGDDSQPTTQHPGESLLLADNSRWVAGLNHYAQDDRHTGRGQPGIGSRRFVNSGANNKWQSRVYKLGLIQEYCEAGPLKELLKKRRLWKEDARGPNIRAVSQLALQIARGMQHLQNKSLVHGDLKPANILLKYAPNSDAGVIAKVADFGLSV